MKHRQHRKVLIARLRRLSAVGHLALLLIGVNYWLTQVVEGGHYRDQAENNRLRQLAIEAPRGLIYDRQGRALVENVPSYDLFLDRSLSRDVGASLRFAASVLGTPVAELEEVLAAHRGTPSFQPVPIAGDLSLADVARLGAQQLEFPEFDIQVEHLRLYRHAHQTAHVLGHLGEVTTKDLGHEERAYLPGDLIGKKGIEGIYEERLRGVDGERVVVVDSRGRPSEEFERKAAEPGQDLTLTLDLELQQEAARLLEDKVGAIVAMDPRNGDILAMVSSPSFNPNHFARRLDRDQWQSLLENPHHPLQNRTLQNKYPPGSVFKMIMGLAGLNEGMITPEETVLCTGSTTFYNRRRRCWKASGHGRVDLHGAIQHSCDVYFYVLGQKLGVDLIAEWARTFRLGRPTGVDLDGEQAGLVPDTAWSREIRRSPWYPGETISVAIGQGPILVTPTQVAAMTATLANGGRWVRPRLVADAPPHLEPRIPVSEESLELVRRAMWSVVNAPEGTGGSARIDGFDVAGKTGTVQVIGQETWTDSDDLAPEHRDHAWFTSFAPFEDPRLVVVVFVEHGGKGSSAAAPFAKAIHEKFFEADLAHRHPA